MLSASDLTASVALNPLPEVHNSSDTEHLAQGGLATAFDLAAFRLSMIAPVKKSVNHSRTVASTRETGWETTTPKSSSSQRFDSVK